MKKSILRAFALALFLGAQIFAQRFTAAEPDIFQTGYLSGSADTGYLPNGSQIAALGEKRSSYANLILVHGRNFPLWSWNEDSYLSTYNVVNSHGNVLGTVQPLSQQNIFTSSNGTRVVDNKISAVAVLDSLSDSKKTATVLFSTLRKLILMQISISEANIISSSVLSTVDMPEAIWQSEGSYNYAGSSRRLALLGASQHEGDKTYHFATANPYSNCGIDTQCGRVDFFSLNERTWTILQPNTKGLTTGENGLMLGRGSLFGKDLVAIDDFDKKGGKALAVLLPASTQYPNSAIYIFQMDNDWTPSAKPPVAIAGNSKPWLEDPEQIQDCQGLGIANWSDENHLFVSCNLSKQLSSNTRLRSIAVKNIVLDSVGRILNSSVLFSRDSDSELLTSTYGTNSNPLAIKKHKNDLPAIFLALNGPVAYAARNFIMTFPVIDADYSKNHPIEAGKREIIADIDSLFYRSGTTGFSAKTLSGLAQCEIQNKDLICNGSENAIGSWSSIELSSASGCDAYKACKRRDTIFVYVRSQNESSNTALRIPKKMLVPYYSRINLNNIKSLSYFKNPNLQNTNLSWNTNGLKLGTVSGNLEDGLSIIPFSQNEGIDTLVFNLSIATESYNYPIHLHIADTSKILESGVPATPGIDTVWNTAAKRYIALPHANANGNIYTYDIAQNGLQNYAEIVGGYLHILRVDVADINVAYTENSEIKQRKITLMPIERPEEKEEEKEEEEEEEDNPNFIRHFDSAQLPNGLRAFYARGGIQIKGIGELEIVAYNLKGIEIQREKVYAGGSAFVKLRQNGPQMVQIKAPVGKTYISIFLLHGTPRHN
ncbi:MAG: hypothetical protein LBC85_10675 [Fibromonadaceae bacterium]|nr:hypothetical protein [Fibromonadaceae bacterium]